MTSRIDLRFKAIITFVILFAFILVVRLYFVQIVHGDQFSRQADGQYVSTEDSFDRGAIFFERRDGTHVPAASLAGGYILAIHPERIDDPKKVYNELSSVIEIDEEGFLKKANLKDDPYEKITDHISPEIKDKIEDLSLSGVSLYQEYWRFYPGEDLASDAVGFVAYSDDELLGQYGLERYYDEILSRRNQEVYVNFFAEIFSQIGRAVDGKLTSSSGDLVTSIEPVVQRHLEDTLFEIKNDWSSTMTAGIVMDPKTGFIYAMAENPSYNLNNFSDIENARLYSNSLVESVYEMGSIFKPITMAAGLDAGAVTPSYTYNDKGSIELDGKKISNYDGKARGIVPMQEVLNQSLNTGAAHVALKMGTNNFRDYIKKFGIGEETGIDLPNEAKGLTSNLSSPRQVEYATASFGQGVAISPISMTQALAVLGNGGYLVKPKLVKEISYETGYNDKIKPEKVRQVIDEETSEVITRMLVEVVDDALLGGTVAMDTHSIAAKTGTAQMAAPGGGYYDDKFLHTFFGYFPAYEPRFLIFLMNIEPKNARYASETLTHPFIDLTQFLIQYYQIPPDRGKADI